MTIKAAAVITAFQAAFAFWLKKISNIDFYKRMY